MIDRNKMWNPALFVQSYSMQYSSMSFTFRDLDFMKLQEILYTPEILFCMEIHPDGATLFDPTKSTIGYERIDRVYLLS